MAIGDVNPSSFEAYEGIRILIPGAIAVTIFASVVATFAPSISSPASNALAAVVAALLAGLALLFLDLPVKSVAYRNPLLPDRELRSWHIDPSPYGDHLNLYFVMLDVSFPATIRNRSLYMGAIFRIGFEGLYLLGLTSVGVVVTAAAFPKAGPLRGGTTATQAVLFATAGAHVATLIGAIVARLLYKLDPNHKDWLEASRAVWRELAGDLGSPGFFALLAGLYAFAPAADTHSALAVIAAVGIPIAAWAVLYFRGRPGQTGADLRRRLSPPTAVLLYAMSCTFACIEAGLRITSQSTFDTEIAFAWCIASLMPALLILSRGHERKLNGSFKAQTTWMRLNKDALIRSYKLRPTSPLTGGNAHPR
jgi:hypothetical protein